MLLVKVIFILEISCELIYWAVQKLFHWVVCVYHQILKLTTHWIAVGVWVLSNELSYFLFEFFRQCWFWDRLSLLFSVLFNDIFLIFMLGCSIGLFSIGSIDKFRLIHHWLFKFINIVRIHIGLNILYILNIRSPEMPIMITHLCL